MTDEASCDSRRTEPEFGEPNQERSEQSRETVLTGIVRRRRVAIAIGALGVLGTTGAGCHRRLELSLIEPISTAGLTAGAVIWAKVGGAVLGTLSVLDLVHRVHRSRTCPDWGSTLIAIFAPFTATLSLSCLGLAVIDYFGNVTQCRFEGAQSVSKFGSAFLFWWALCGFARTRAEYSRTGRADTSRCIGTAAMALASAFFATAWMKWFWVSSLARAGSDPQSETVFLVFPVIVMGGACVTMAGAITAWFDARSRLRPGIHRLGEQADPNPS